MEKNNKALFALPILILFLISFVSAETPTLTVIAGKIYAENFGESLSDCDITVKCNESTLTTDCLEDGTYAVRFEASECAEGDSVSVTASGPGLESKEETGIVSGCEEECNSSYVAIININLDTKTNDGESGGRSRSRYYNCGNNICDTGENIFTCPLDCLNKEPEVEQLSTDNNPPEPIVLEKDQFEKEENSESKELEQSGFSAMTGAVIGTVGSSKGILGIFGVILIISLITISVVRRNKR